MTTMMQRVLKAIAYMEDNLDDEFQLAKVSEAACYSHYHFLRIFHAVTGMTAGTYIRRRRLTKAAEALLNGETRIIELAQAAGFNSQAALTRAFKDMFGCAPAQFRRHEEHSSCRGQPLLTEGYLQHLQRGAITMNPRFEHKEPLTFIGLGRDCLLSKPQSIGAIWDDFLPQKHLIGSVLGEAAYGLCYAPKQKEVFSEKFHYTAALRVEGDATVPKGMEKIGIPAHEYAVFTHKGGLVDMAKTNDYIWKTWLPLSGVELADAPDFEMYGNRWDAAAATGEIDIFVPIVR